MTDKRAKIALQIVAAIAGVAVLKVILVMLDDHGVIHASTPLPPIVLGILVGLTYGLLSVGLVLIYRTNRIINFAHGQIGAFGAAFFGLAAVKWGVPYWIVFPFAIALAGGVGAAAETGVVRRLRKAPPLMSIVATLGVGEFLLVFAQAINSQASAGSLFPEPPGFPTFNIGALKVTRAYSGMLILCPIVVVALMIFLRRSRFGLAMRSAAANPEVARMSGIFASRMSSLAWAIAGGLSALTAILTAPTQGFTSAGSFGPELLLRAMTGAVIARMDSIPVALGAGIGLGVIEQLLLWNYPQSGLVEVALFGLILVTLLVQRPRGGRASEKGSWTAVRSLKPVPDRLKEIWLIRNLGLLTGLVALAVAASLPIFVNNSNSVTMTGIIGFAIVGLSIGLLTGLGGQLTLGQFAVAAVGAVVAYYVSRHTGDFALAVLYAGLAAAAVSVLIGLPSLRIRGLMLTVTTLSFALATPAWLLNQPWMLGDGRTPGHPTVFGHSLDTGRSYYYFALGLLALTVILARNIRSGGFGRLLTAVRDNEDNARAFTVRASIVKIQGYLLAGFIAGIGGAAYAYALSNIGSATFPTEASIDVVVMTVIGGVSVLAGPIIGALWVIGVPAFVPLDSAGLAATQLGSLLLILFFPRGLAQLAEPVRDRFVTWIGRRRGVDLAAEQPALEETAALDESAPVANMAAPPPSLMRIDRRPPAHGTVLLEAIELDKGFGGVHAVQGVSFTVSAGETLGLIGPNGAGKTTTFELLAGFSKLDSGRVIFHRRDVTQLGPENRAKLGLIRSFQDAALFPTMTVEDAVTVACERVLPTRLLPSLIGFSPTEKAKRQHARELVTFMGLDRYRHRQIDELSTGTRRIAEIACLVALQPVCLLLDEPSSGIAQRETEALGHLLLDLREQFSLTMVIIEHDIPLIMSISDRILAMADGKVIANGTPEEVRAVPAVVEAYLGGSIAAIERSGQVTHA